MLDELHKINKYYFELILTEIQDHIGSASQKKIDYMTDLFLYSPYRFYTTTLIDAITKTVQSGKHFDISQLS